jgi:hypothetical protein
MLMDDKGNMAYGFFDVKVRVPTGLVATNVQIMAPGNPNPVGRLVRSSIKPVVQILSPANGAQLGASTLISFSVSDADSPTTNRQCQIVYSPNDGVTWFPVAVNLPGSVTFALFDSSQIVESSGQGRIRVIASDGLNTGYADVTGLTPLAAKFPNPDEPRLRIELVRNQAIISWPGDVASWPTVDNGFRLQTSAKLDAPAWRNVTNAIPTLVNGRYTVPVSVGATSSFYQLRR